MPFEDLKLIEPLLCAVREEGYTTPTPIQERAIPEILAQKDLLGCAQTGTGKTAAFALPILQKLSVSPLPAGRRPIRVLVLTPTRELASQIGDSFSAYGRHLGLRHTVVYGGVGQRPQEQALRAGVDILVATPGRLLDLAQQKILRLDRIEIFVLDEADRMLDMGFIHDVKRVVLMLPERRQTLFFSATMPPDIQNLARSILKNPVKVAVDPVSSTVEKIEQSIYFVERPQKRDLLRHILQNPEVTRALVFTRTKRGADRVVLHLQHGGVKAEVIHGDKAQSVRERAMERFKEGKVRVLVATDIAARGIDVEEISHVINFDLPEDAESYVHRIGRTARAGASGKAISFCDMTERPHLVGIERLIQKNIPVVAKHPFPSPLAPTPTDLAPRWLQPARTTSSHSAPPSSQPVVTAVSNTRMVFSSGRLRRRTR